MDTNSERGIRRKRVTRACDSCRVLKAKCDGQRPICGRCAGYGYTCLWNKSTRVRGESLGLLAASDEIQKLRQAVRKYDNLLRGLRSSLPEDDRKAVDLRLSAIQVPAWSSECPTDLEVTTQTTPNGASTENGLPPAASHRYLGEASDITFFHAMKQQLTLRSNVDAHEESSSTEHMDSYEQDGQLRLAGWDEDSVSLPPRATADKFLDIYFSTIHIAYPFIWEPLFREKYRGFWKSDSLEGFRGPWLSILLTVFAIGACYETFADSCQRSPKAHRHQIWFDQAVAISQSNEKDQCMDHICALLAQCFYLLATCQTDRVSCWTTLGKAIRTSQSIGLHTENCQRPLLNDFERIVMPEMRRRLWYSLYVLDQLLSLQLGRPPAIHEGGFKVTHPSAANDVSILKGVTGSGKNAATPRPPPPPPPAGEAQAFSGEYFLEMIRFSEIITRVFSLLYGPNRSEDAATTLSTIQRLDQELLKWRSSLPRSLRFDLAHTFERSVGLKRQRNMLAIKFYNLRALIHRPLLSPSQLLKSCPDPSRFYQNERSRIVQSKKKCVVAAQHTARLLHDVADKQQLIYGFPWWQMISCLICASSILLVASLCMGRDGDGEEGDEIDWLAVEEDADVCLTVFRELSTNSNAARLAEKMMQGLKETRLHRGTGPQVPSGARRRSSSSRHSDILMIAASSTSPVVLASHAPVSSGPGSGSGSGEASSFNFMDPGNSAFDAIVPFDLSEPVIWSSQFVNAAYNPFFFGQPAPTELDDL